MLKSYIPVGVPSHPHPAPQEEKRKKNNIMIGFSHFSGALRDNNAAPFQLKENSKP